VNVAAPACIQTPGAKVVASGVASAVVANVAVVVANVAAAVVVANAVAEGAKNISEIDAMNTKIKSQTEEKNMKSHENNLTSSVPARFPALILLVVLCTASCSVKKPAETASPSPAVFATPDEAGQALRSAAKAKDESRLAKIMGPGSEAILHSGDTAEDQATLESFVAKYDRMNRWVTMTDGSKILYIGADNYPFPIPLATDSSSKWHFDTKAGEDELLARRIGRNELLAIDAVSAIANAEELYYQKPHNDQTAHQYTSLIISSPGKQDGLYWDVPEGQGLSPLGKLNDFTNATSITPTETAFDGYSFRILSAQGDKAKGGVKAYVANGEMTGGFAIIATPVKYQDSGIMTFMLSREGTVYQKDLGPNTSASAASIKDYNPSADWIPAE
jgi:hypothetical protein